jgi:hypothetical protein
MKARSLSVHLRATRTGLALLLLAIFGMAIPLSAGAATPEIALRVEAPDTVTAGKKVKLIGIVENSGTVPLTGVVTFENTFPTGITPVAPDPFGGFPADATCAMSSQTTTCSIPVEGLLPGGLKIIPMTFVLPSDSSGVLLNSMRAFGGGAPNVVDAQQQLTVGPPELFLFKEFSAVIRSAQGTATSAGSHPSSIQTNVRVSNQMDFPYGGKSSIAPVEQPRNILVHSPAGLVGNPQATPVKCTGEQLSQAADFGQHQIPLCPPESQVGVVQINGLNEAGLPLYNMVSLPSKPAQFGFAYNSVPVLLDARVRPEDYGLDIVVSNTASSLPVSGARVTLWGVPSDTSHDSVRGVCLDGYRGASGEICPSNAPREAFLRLPTSCTGTLPWKGAMDSYLHPNVYVGASTVTPGIEECDRVPFTPSATVAATTTAAASPTGLEVHLSIPQDELTNPAALAQSDLRNARVTLPPGFSINAAAASGLASCSQRQIGLSTNRAPSCPQESKLGSAAIETPLLERPLEGSIYLAAQGDNPFGSLLAMYIVVEGSGVVLKLAGKVSLDPQTGQLTTTFENQPQLPFSELSLKLDGGPRAPLRTAATCGRHTAEVVLTPWSGSDPVELPSDLSIISGPGGGQCASSQADRPFAPRLTAGTENPLAGAFSPLLLRMTRDDGTKEITEVQAKMPEGLLGKLAGIPYCPDSVLGGIYSTEGAAALEMATPSCPSASQVGTVQVGAGSGPRPFYTEGNIYLAGPYKGAPLSIAVVTPVLAGPFDLGNVVVRNALHVDSRTTELTAVSDPFPTILHGIPLDLRDIRLDINRNGFTMNPTDCDATAITGSLGGVENASVTFHQRFQVGHCDRLGFKPKLSLRLKGQTKRVGHPALSAVLRIPSGDANLSKISVALPHSEFLAQAHISTICTRVQYAAGGGGGEECPKGSVYGHARAFSPLLDRPLEGFVYLRSNGGERKLPDLVASLNGQIHVDLVGYIDSVNGGIRTQFEHVPDAAISRFVLTMKGGRKSLLENSTHLCKRRHHVRVKSRAQSGMMRNFKVRIGVKCGASMAKKRTNKIKR